MVIFLDIDGVMIPAKGWKSPEILNDGFPAFSRQATHALQSLLTKDTTVVLTTSHKSNFSIDEWKEIFRKRGITIDNLKSLPKNINNISRKDEILNWFALNNTNLGFIILDDDRSLNDIPGYLKANLIQTSPYIGLTEEHVAMAKTILQKALPSA